VKRIADAGHEVGCHSYYHRLVYEQTPEAFEADLAGALAILRDVSGQPVVTYRAPSFSITNACFWAYPILRRHGIEIDVSMVPAKRDNGGVTGVDRDPFLLDTGAGTLRCFPVSVMDLLGRRIPFSGGGYLRLLPSWLIHRGFRQNHAQGRCGMSYIHPREVNPDQPRLPLPALKGFKYYVNLSTTRRKLRDLIETFPFTTVSEVCRSVTRWPAYRLAGDRIVPVEADARPAA
jgi:polysaccharide deacetylase family protein (PEP-CTERM system associated)